MASNACYGQDQFMGQAGKPKKKKKKKGIFGKILRAIFMPHTLITDRFKKSGGQGLSFKNLLMPHTIFTDRARTQPQPQPQQPQRPDTSDPFYFNTGINGSRILPDANTMRPEWPR